MVTATFGVAAQARKLSKGDISAEDFIDNCEIVCLDVAVSALSSMLGEVLIPVPVLGAIIGNTVGISFLSLLSESRQKSLFVKSASVILARILLASENKKRPPTNVGNRFMYHRYWLLY